FQFRLKTLFVLTLIVASFFGGMAVQRQVTDRAKPKDAPTVWTLVPTVYTTDLSEFVSFPQAPIITEPAVGAESATENQP
ncbi:MAG TPA: hypothetical protein VGX78_10520, partial [Pirellulales bacterium]|nr:hypothetical protein [Pirellulales bacterium]